MTTRTPTASAGSGDMSLQARIADACNGKPASVSPPAILALLQEQVPELRLGYAMTRTGWHRLGGVVDADHRPVAQHLAAWAQAQSGGDLERLLDTCAASGGFVTRLEGRTHYLTAVTGERARDYIQIEVEQVQEVIERSLWTPDWMPDDLEDFIDPLDCPRLAPEPVAPPRLLFRRLVRVAELIESEDASANIKRFLSDWDRSSAATSACFCDHWILGLRDYRDLQGYDRLSAKPLLVPSEEVPDLPDARVTRGAGLANLIHGFDRRIGYRFAWYFHMLTRRQVSYKLAEAVHADLMDDYDYLPARDVAVLRDWCDAPYSV
ncbi:hypothetical protein [Candidatus Thiosymbion oneisti]|uniref:hypothetical protein n=1 Tax=Candidatus Thiosymbion oneisti TaxID=589554 RepID=UPI000B0732AA|nr:hypothetical protein [Candidatus Thiosymbion oneisti]